MPIKQSSLPSLRGDGPALPKIYILEVFDREDPTRLRAHVIVEECEEINEDHGTVY